MFDTVRQKNNTFQSNNSQFVVLERWNENHSICEYSFDIRYIHLYNIIEN